MERDRKQRYARTIMRFVIFDDGNLVASFDREADATGGAWSACR
jgi:hypothetical protein